MANCSGWRTDSAGEIGLRNDARTPIGVLADNSPHQVAAYVAASFCCRPYAPLSPAYPLPMLQELVDPFEITILVHDRLSAAQAGELRVSFRLNAERLTWRVPASGGRASKSSPERAAWHHMPHVHLWLHRQAQGVLSIPYRAIRNLVACPDYVELGPHYRVAYVANPAFDASLFEIRGALLNGATLVHLALCAPRRTPTYSQGFSGTGGSRLFFQLRLSSILSRATAVSLSSPSTTSCSAGSRVSVEAVREIYSRSRPARLVHVYGPTECTTFSTFHQIDAMPEANSDLPIGRPIKGTGAVKSSLQTARLSTARAGANSIFSGGSGRRICG